MLPSTETGVQFSRIIHKGCRYLGSCGSKKVEDEDANLQPQYKESNCIATKLRSPKSLELVMNPIGPGYGRWLCIICGHFPASFSRYVAQMGHPGTANGRDRARMKVGYDLSTKWAV